VGLSVLSQNATRIMSGPSQGRASVACCQVSSDAGATGVADAATVRATGGAPGVVTTGLVTTGVAGAGGGGVTGAAVEAVDSTVCLGTERCGVAGSDVTTGARCSLRCSGRTRISASSTGSDDETRQIDGEIAGDRARVPADESCLIVPGDGDGVEHRTPIRRRDAPSAAP